MTFNLKPAAVISIIIAMIILTAVVLLAMGRTPICECGFVKLWHGDVLSSQNSQQFADPYSFTHIIHGIIFYFILWLLFKSWPLGLRGVTAVAVESLWEIAENTPFIIERYRAATISLDYYGDSVLNSVGDIVIMALAFWLVSRIPIWAAIAGFILIEVALAFWIRDGLMLNIIMLIYPIEAIKTWQMGL